jgi:tetratricopeptide (TPR) repeat protein
MVISPNNNGRARLALRDILTCVALLLVGVTAEADPRFVASARVSADDASATISIQFNCKVGYLRHAPDAQGDRLRIELDSTTICNGISPQAAQSRARLRPANADAARLVDIEYYGDTPEGPTLVLNFSQPVTFVVADASTVDFRLDVRVGLDAAVAGTPDAPDKTVLHRRVVHEREPVAPYIINLASFRRIPTSADAPGIVVPEGLRLFFSEAMIDGITWYRLRVGDFASAEEARAALPTLGREFPDAWIDQRDPGSVDVALIGAATVAAAAIPDDADEIDRLMAEARREIVSGNAPRAIQIYTKILQMPPHPRHPEAQEYLAVAREKQGQLAHAKAEYQRYLSLYPNAEGAARVSQRLAAMLAGNRPPGSATSTVSAADGRRNETGDWRFQTFFSQYYRRDVNQPSDQQETISQSALYSDVNFDARRRGERFDFSARLSAGYRSDFLGEDEGSGSDARVSYAYADVDDARTGVRARLGRQSRNTGGVLGRFDGLNVSYQATERMLVSTVFGKPAYSANDGVNSARTFYGASINYGPLLGGLELGGYVIQQTIEDIDDREAVGFEFRYFGENQSIWGLVDYDTGYSELSNAFLQTNWRLTSRLSLHGSIDRRRSPFLSTGNALIGQPVSTFEELAEMFRENELRELALDRSPISTTYSFGIAHSVTPNLQINVDGNYSEIDATQDSGGVFGSAASEYSYLSTSLVASSLFREGDVMIFGARYADSGTAKVATLTFDGRFPFRSGLRVNPRLRVDRRERVGQGGYEWLYTPGLRIQYRWSRRFRIEFEAGKQFSEQDIDVNAADRESYFVNLGYQAYF